MRFRWNKLNKRNSFTGKHLDDGLTMRCCYRQKVKDTYIKSMQRKHTLSNANDWTVANALNT